jgi:replicative DNA helicase
MAAIAAKVRAAHRRHGVGLIMIDHLHIVQPDAGDIKHGPTWGVGRISGAMKRLAKEFDAPVLLAAQLNRGVDGREDKRPGLVDLRQSGDIEQDADTVMFVYRPDYYLKAQPERRREESSEQFERRLSSWHDQRAAVVGKAEIIIAKQRDGDTRTVTLQWNGETTSFSEVPEHD